MVLTLTFYDVIVLCDEQVSSPKTTSYASMEPHFKRWNMHGNSKVGGTRVLNYA
jgi:hypothetical protein